MVGTIDDQTGADRFDTVRKGVETAGPCVRDNRRRGDPFGKLLGH